MYFTAQSLWECCNDVHVCLSIEYAWFHPYNIISHEKNEVKAIWWNSWESKHLRQHSPSISFSVDTLSFRPLWRPSMASSKTFWSERYWKKKQYKFSMQHVYNIKYFLPFSSMSVHCLVLILMKVLPRQIQDLSPSPLGDFESLCNCLRASLFLFLWASSSTICRDTCVTS